MRVAGFRNLFEGGEKAGPNVGIQECIVTGALAGYNAARYAFRQVPLVLPRTTLIGDFVAYVREMMQSERGLMETYSFMKPAFRRHMADRGWWAKTVPQAIEEAKERIAGAGLTGIMAKKVG